jgi:hypothetical protein
MLPAAPLPSATAALVLCYFITEPNSTSDFLFISAESIEHIDLYQGYHPAADAMKSANILEWFMWKSSETQMESGCRPTIPQPEEDSAAIIFP